MEWFLYYLVRASFLMVLFWGFYKLFFARTTFHSINRAMLLVVVMIITVLPLFRFHLLPEKVVDPILVNPFSIDFSTISMAEGTSITPSLSIPWTPLLMAVFVAGLLFTVTRCLTGLGQIIILIRRSEKHLLDDGTVVCVCNQPISPFSWMKYVVLSEEDFLTDHHAILRHEMAHIHLNHSMDMILFDLFTCLFWFNPFSWLLRREIQSIHEYQADACVLQVGVDPKKYQLLLIRKSVGEQKFTLANNFRRRDLHQRIIMMMKNRTNQQKKWNYALALPVLLLALVVLSIPRLNAQSSQNAGDSDTLLQLSMIDYQSREFKVGKAEEKPNPPDSTGHVKIAIRGMSNLNDPLIIVDHRKISPEEFNKLKPDEIKSISVLKDKSAIELYGKEGENGVILIETKTDVKNKGIGATGNIPIVRSVNDLDLSVPFLYVLDGEKMGRDFDLHSLESKDIESITVLKGKSAVDAYGEEGKDGVFIITRKKR